MRSRDLCAPDTVDGDDLVLALSLALADHHLGVELRARISRVEQNVLALVATFTMAAFSFYVVERPIRYGRAPWLGASKRRLAVAVPVCLVVVVGLTFRVTSDHDADHSETPCVPGSPTTAGLRWCVQNDPAVAAAPVIATAGDSTARSLSPGLIGVAERRSWRYVQAAQNGCSVLPLEFTAGNEGCPESVPQCWLPSRR